MNDKTEQSLADALRCTAAGGHAEIINVPGYPLMVRAVDYNNLRAQLAEAQKDAERWRFFRHISILPVADDHPLYILANRLIQGNASADDVDAAIDNAKGKTP